MIRRFFVFLHRWIGLLMTVFLVIVGLTGSILAFSEELEHAVAPQLFATPRPGVPRLDLATLIERAPQIPHARLIGLAQMSEDHVPLQYQAEMDPATGKPYPLGFDQLFVDPWTGAELARRTRADISEGFVNLMPFTLRLHDALLVRGTGTLILGIVAIFWTLDCFNGFFLTLPTSLFGFWRKWKTAWLVKRGAGAYRLNFDLHRAGGLWLWPMLLVFAWSSVMFNIRPVYDWTMSKIMNHPSMLDNMKAMTEAPKRAAKPSPALDLRAAMEVGARLSAERAKQLGLEIPDDPMVMVNYMDKMGVYFYASGSRVARDGFLMPIPTAIAIDGDSGEPIDLPMLKFVNERHIIDRWLSALHTAHVFGLPYKVFVCVLGLIVAMLSVTGVYIWWKKRKARRFHKTKSISAGAPLEATIGD